MGFMVDKVAKGQVFYEYFGFLCHSFHRLLSTHHHPSSGAGTIDQIMAEVPTGLSLTTPQETKRKVVANWRQGLILQLRCRPLSIKVNSTSNLNDFSEAACRHRTGGMCPQQTTTVNCCENGVESTSSIQVGKLESMVYDTQNYSVSGLCPLSRILNTREHDVSETGSVCDLRWGERDAYSVGSLRKS
jgi:hypothetical protein